MIRTALRKAAWRLLALRAPEWRPHALTHPTLVFSPHYDDETLGAGATIARLRQLGTPVHIVFMTDGSRSHAAAISGAALAALRREEGLRAAAALGVGAEQVEFLDYPETELARHGDAASARVAALMMRLDCRRVLIPSTWEPEIWSSDHRATSDIVRDALRRTGRRCEVVEYLVWFWYHWPWVPVWKTGDSRRILALTWRYAFGLSAWQAVNASVPLAEHAARKRHALAEHRTQTTRLTMTVPWPILEDVARGAFLENIFGPREWLRVSTSDAGGHAS
jgi:LmbE family N-acetylglucosaminyl deacetylase